MPKRGLTPYVDGHVLLLSSICSYFHAYTLEGMTRMKDWNESNPFKIELYFNLREKLLLIDYER